MGKTILHKQDIFSRYYDDPWFSNGTKKLITAIITTLAYDNVVDDNSNPAIQRLCDVIVGEDALEHYITQMVRECDNGNTVRPNGLRGYLPRSGKALEREMRKQLKKSEPLKNIAFHYQVKILLNIFGHSRDAACEYFYQGIGRAGVAVYTNAVHSSPCDSPRMIELYHDNAQPFMYLLYAIDHWNGNPCNVPVVTIQPRAYNKTY